MATKRDKPLALAFHARRELGRIISLEPPEDRHALIDAIEALKAIRINYEKKHDGRNQEN